jgi:hypothetical protein
MKKIIFLAVLCFSLHSFSQTKEFTILDSITKQPIKLVHITYPSLSVGSITNADGKIKIPLKEESILISHINYNEKILSYEDFLKKDVINLSQKLTQLNEIVLSNVKLKDKFSFILDNYLKVYASKKIINYSTYKETFKVNDSLKRLFQTQLKWWSKNSLVTFKKPLAKQNRIEIESIDYSKVEQGDKVLSNSNGGYIENEHFFKFGHLNFLLSILVDNTDDFFIHNIKKTENDITIIFDGVFSENKRQIFEFTNSSVTFNTDYSAIKNLQLNMIYNTGFTTKKSKDNKIAYETKTTKHAVEISFKKLKNDKLSINYYLSKIDAIIKINKRIDIVSGTQDLFITNNEFGKNLKSKDVIPFNEPFYKSIPENQSKTSSKILLTKEELAFIKN